MKCPQCQFKNPDDYYYCGKCGSQLSTPSMLPSLEQSLKTKLERIRRYLPSALVEKILSQRDEIEGERKQVTIMFCDIKESTPLVEKLGPEEAFSLLNHIYEILLQITHDYGGIVNELRGDGILALFGAPSAIENAPQRALQAALAIQREMSHFNENREHHSQYPLILLRIGLNTGPVVVGSLGNNLRVQFSAVGDTINMAARMEQMAEPGTVYVTEDTFRQTEALFEFKTLGKRAVKGKEKSVTVYKVLSERKSTYRPRLGSERMIYSEMVGRNNELNRLVLQAMKAINGKGSVVNIIGEAGIGKSRLVAELKLLDITDRVSFEEGRAISIGNNLSFHPIIDLLKQWMLIKDDDGEAIALGKLETTIRNIYPEEVSEILPFVATLMGMTLSGKYAERIKGIEGEALKKLILKNVRELFIKTSEITPLVIVLEDLHWADVSSIELLENLYRLAETQRILFVNVFRPGYEETGGRIVNVLREKIPACYTEIVLTPLDEKICRSFITGMLNLSDPHQNAIDQIIRRTGGNPLFIEEIVRSLIDERAVVLKDGILQATEMINAAAIPFTIIDVLTTRIDRLDAETRNMVMSASVIGQKFFHRILSEVATTIDHMDDRLSYLKETQLIRERKRMGEIEYLFNHALTQEAAYDSILPLKKKKLHLKVACAIEKVFAERLHEFYGMLAYHYSKAGNPDETEQYLLKAGEEALKTSASTEALHFYQEALNRYLKKNSDSINTDIIAMHEKNIALALYNKGLYNESLSHFDKALTFFNIKILSNSVLTAFRLFPALFRLIIALYFPLMKYKKTPSRKEIEALSLLSITCKSLSMVDSKRFFIVSLIGLKNISRYNFTKFDLGLQYFTGISSLFSFTGLSFNLSDKIINFGKKYISRENIANYTTYELVETLHNFLSGNWDVLKPYDKDLVIENLKLGNIFDASQHLYWHGFFYIYKGEFRVVAQIIEKLNEIYTDYGNDISIEFKYELSTHLLLEKRKFHEALTEVDRGIKLKLGGHFFVEMYSCQALIHIFMDNLEKAEKSLNTANNIRSEIDNLVPLQLMQIYRSQFAFDLFQLKKSVKNGNKTDIFLHRKNASKSKKRLLKVSRKLAQHQTETYRLIGIYYWLIIRQGKALKWWRRAISQGERLGARLELSRTYHEVGKRLLEPESKYKKLGAHNPEELLLKAKLQYEKIGLQWDLDKLELLSRF